MKEKTKLISFILLLAVAISGASAQSTNPPLLDTFEDGDASEWSVYTGSMSTTTDAINGQYSGLINPEGSTAYVERTNPSPNSPTSYQIKLDADDLNNGVTEVQFLGSGGFHSYMSLANKSGEIELSVYSGATDTQRLNITDNPIFSSDGLPVTIELNNYEYDSTYHFSDVDIDGNNWLEGFPVSAELSGTSSFESVAISTQNNLTVDDVTYSTQTPPVEIDDVNTNPETIHVGEQADIIANVSNAPTNVTYTSNTTNTSSELFPYGSGNGYQTTLNGAENSVDIGTEAKTINATITAIGDSSQDSTNFIYDIEPSRNLDNSNIEFNDELNGSVLSPGGTEYEDAIVYNFTSVADTEFILGRGLNITYYDQDTEVTLNAFDSQDVEQSYNDNNTRLEFQHSLDLSNYDLTESQIQSISNSDNATFTAYMYSSEEKPYQLNENFKSDIITESITLSTTTEQSLLREIADGITTLVTEVADSIAEAITSLIEWITRIIYIIVVGLATLLFYMLWLIFVVISSILSFLFNFAVGLATYHTEVNYMYENESYDTLDDLDERLNETDTALVEVLEGNVHLESNETKAELLSELNSGGMSASNPYLSSEESFNYELTAWGEILQTMNISQPGLEIGGGTVGRADNGVVSLTDESITVYDEDLEEEWTGENFNNAKTVSYTSNGIYTANDTHITRYVPTETGFRNSSTIKYNDDSSNTTSEYEIMAKPDESGITIFRSYLNVSKESSSTSTGISREMIRSYNVDYSLNNVNKRNITDGTNGRWTEAEIAEHYTLEFNKKTNESFTVMGNRKQGNFNDSRFTDEFVEMNYDSSSNSWNMHIHQKSFNTYNKEGLNTFVKTNANDLEGDIYTDEIYGIAGEGSQDIQLSPYEPPTAGVIVHYPNFIYITEGGPETININNASTTEFIVGDKSLYNMHYTGNNYSIQEVNSEQNVYSTTEHLTDTPGVTAELSTYVTRNNSYTTGTGPATRTLYKLDVENAQIVDSVEFDTEANDLAVADSSISTGTTPRYNPNNFEVSFSLITPGENALNELNGIPTGSIVLINLLLSIIGLFFGLIPDPLVEAVEGFFLFIGVIFNYTITFLTAVVELGGWVFTTGVDYTKYVLYAYAGFTGVKYLDILRKALKNQVTWSEAFGLITDDITGKYQRLEANMYRAMDLLATTSLLVSHLTDTIIGIIRSIIQIIKGLSPN